MRDVSEIKSSVEVRLGSLGIADLLWRVPEATPGDTTVADTVLVTLSVFVEEITLLETVTVWLLIGYASYTLGSKAYPGLHLPKERRGFRTVFTAATITAVVMFPLAGQSSHIPQSIGAILVWMCVFVGVFIVYVHHLGWRVHSTDDRTIETLARVLPKEQRAAQQQLRDEWSEPGWHGMFNRTVAWALLGVLAAIPPFLAAGATTVLLAASPLGELIFLSAVAAGAVRKRTRIGTNRPPQQIVDLETYLYNSISHALRSARGFILLLFLFVTLLIGLGGASRTVVFLPNIAGGTIEILLGRREPFLAGLELYLLLSVFIGVMTLVVTGFAYIGWAGLREIPRLAAFIDVQQGKEPRQVPTRPVGFIIPGILMLPVFSVIIESLEAASLSDPLEGGLRLFAIGWPLLLGGFIICWWITRRRESQSVQHENHVIIWSSALLFGVFGFTYDFRAVLMLPVIIGVGYAVDVIEYAT